MDTIETITRTAEEACAKINKTKEAAIASLTKKSNLDKPVTVAGINWSEFLKPSPNCDAQSQFNEKTGLYYFDQLTSAPLHAFEQNMRMATSEEYRQLYDRTTQRNEKVDGLEYKVFTDVDTHEELWWPFSGLYDFKDQKFNFVGDSGYYWSSSVYSSSHGYNLGFGSGNVNPQGNSNRRYGFPVRCVE